MSPTSPSPARAARPAPSVAGERFAATRGETPRASFADLVHVPPPTDLAASPLLGVPSKEGSPGSAATASEAAPDETVDADGDREGAPHRGDRLDAEVRVSAQLAPPPTTAPPPERVAPTPQDPSAPPPTARASLEELLPALVRRVAWSGDGRRGAVRMELGAGGLAGGVVLVEADAGRIRVHVTAPAGEDAAAWRARIEERLAKRGLDVERVEVE